MNSIVVNNSHSRLLSLVNTLGCKLFLELFSYAEKNGFEIKNLKTDLLLAAYLLQPSSSSYGLDKLCISYGLDFPVVDNSDKELYSAVYLMPELCNKVLADVEAKGMTSLLNDIEIPLANVLAKMENVGFSVDKEGIADYGEILGAQIKNLEQEIYNEVGYEFNINSPKQLGVALFEELGLPSKKKTKSGYSTNAEVLESLRYSYPVVEMVLSYRTLAKLKSTYCDGLLKVIGEDGRIHSSFNQTETRTGRISSTEPNLQNIPVRTELGREMRKFFTAKEGCVLVDADYSCLSAEDKACGVPLGKLAVLELKVDSHNRERVKELSLVLVQTLNLNVENHLRVNLYAVHLLDISGKLFFLLSLDFIKFLNCIVVHHLVELGELA